MDFERDKKDKEVYHFSKKGKHFISIRLADRIREGFLPEKGGEFRLIRAFDSQGEMLIEENIRFDPDEGYSYHPLNELFGLVGLNESKYRDTDYTEVKKMVKKIKIINQLLKK
jgi:hypothetical protein